MREMRKVKRRMARGACALILVAGVAGGGSSGVGWAAPGDELWATRYSGPGNGGNEARSLAVSPGGTRVFVTGRSYGSGTKWDYATIAYDASSGAKVWEARHDGGANLDDEAYSLAVSPDGRSVFVTGYDRDSVTGADYATIAYDASDGTQLWEARYKGLNDNSSGVAYSLAVSPEGGWVYVTGSSCSSTTWTSCDYATVAYNAITGAQLWVARYNGSGNSYDGGRSLAVGYGSRVYVTGKSDEGSSYYDYKTIAYDAGTGEEIWERRYNGPGNLGDGATSLALSEDGNGVFVTGESYGSGDYDYATVAYSTTTGDEFWVARYDGPGNGDDSARSLAPSPDGTLVFVTGDGYSVGTLSGAGYDYATIAYDATTGAKVWGALYNGPGNGGDFATSVVASPEGSALYVTGESWGSGTARMGYATIAYDAPSGAQLWEARYDGPGPVGADWARSLAVSGGGRRLFVTGDSYGSGGSDYATVAYDTGICTTWIPWDSVFQMTASSGVPTIGPVRMLVHRVNCDVVAANGP